MDIEDYIEAHISPEPPLLSEVVRDTYLYHLTPACAQATCKEGS